MQIAAGRNVDDCHGQLLADIVDEQLPHVILSLVSEKSARGLSKRIIQPRETILHSIHTFGLIALFQSARLTGFWKSTQG